MLDLLGGWLSIQAWGHDRKEPPFLFGIRWSRKVQSWAKHNTLFICPEAKKTQFSIETHLFQLRQSTYGRCYLLWGSCSSYSYRNNGIFLTEPEIWMSESGWPLPVLLHWCHLGDVCVCVCAFTAYARVLWAGRRWEGEKKKIPLLCFLLSLHPKAALTLSYQNIYQTKPPNCMWFGKLV